VLEFNIALRETASSSLQKILISTRASNPYLSGYQCLCGRISSLSEVRKQVAAWTARQNDHTQGIHRQFTIGDARIKWDSVYPKFHSDNE
jgi:hypothetical protein